jgi:hypothetical protein
MGIGLRDSVVQNLYSNTSFFFSIPKEYDVNFLIIISSVLSSISEIVKKILSPNSEILFLLSNQ